MRSGKRNGEESMIYAMSDIHGQYEQFLTLLEQIGIRKEDTLYILGDVVDRGPEPMKILKYMMAHSNIIPIIGNHEVMALPISNFWCRKFREIFWINCRRRCIGILPTGRRTAVPVQSRIFANCRRKNGTR